MLYLTKDSTRFLSAHQRWFTYRIVVYSTLLQTLLPRQGALAVVPLLSQKGSWMLLWEDKGQGRVYHRAEQTWQNRSVATFAASHPPLSPIFLIHLSSHLYDHISVEVSFGPFWWMCLLSLLLSHVILSQNIGCTPHWHPGTWHGYVAGSVALTDPTLNVLSFISQAHYLDRVVKGMVFLPLFSCCLCVCVCV